jgi:hypothetical protein
MTTKECIQYDRIVEFGIATADEINLVRCIIAGSWQYVFDCIVYARTGHSTLDDYILEQMEDYEETTEEDIEED